MEGGGRGRVESVGGGGRGRVEGVEGVEREKDLWKSGMVEWWWKGEG